MIKKIGTMFFKKIKNKEKIKPATLNKNQTDDKIIINDNLYYNKLTKQYIVFLKTVGKNVSITDDDIQSIFVNYSDLFHDPCTIEDLQRMLSWPKNSVIELLKILELNHSSIPVPPHDFTLKSDSEILEDLDTQRRFKLKQCFEKKIWTEIIGESLKWREFKFKTLDPFEKFTQNIVPLESPKFKFQISNSDYYGIIGLSDIHVGAHTEARYLFNKEGKGWSLEDTHKAIDKYLNNIFQLTKTRTYKLKELCVISAGDILHGLYGKTAKGTDLEVFPMGEEQFDQAFNILARFLQGLSELLPLNRVVSLTGNHSLSDAHIFKCLKAYFKNYSNLIFNIYDSRWAVEIVGELGLVIEHGASPFYKHKLPPTGSQRDSYIQKLIWEMKDKLSHCKQIAYISADQHHFEYNERGNYEQIMFSTIVGGDKFANHHGYINKPRQNGLIIQDGKIKEVLNFYFD